MNNEEKPVLTYVKRADRTLHKINIPKRVLELFGSEYIMKVYSNRVELIPTNIPNGIVIGDKYGFEDDNKVIKVDKKKRGM